MKKCFQVLMLLVILGLAQSAQAAMLIPPTRVGSSDWGTNESVNQMFSWANPVLGQPDPGINIDTGGYCWDSGGEFNLIAWMDFGADKIFSALDFATQNNNDGFNRVKLWISNDLSAFTVINGSTPPTGTPDLNVTCGANGSNFAQYALATPITARYVVAQFLSERITDTGHWHPRAWELRMEGTAVALLPYVWTSDPNNGGTTNWSTAANWAPSVPDGATHAVTVGNLNTTGTIDLLALDGIAGRSETIGQLTFSGSVATTIQSSGSPTPGKLIFGSASGPSVQVLVGSGSAAHTDIISAPMTLAASANIKVASAADQLTLSGPIEGAGGLSLDAANAGRVVLSSLANTFSGATTVNAGVLQAHVANTLSPNSGVTISGGLLDVTGGSQTVSSFTIGSGELNLYVGNLLKSNGVATFNGGTLNLSNLLSLSHGTNALIAYSSQTGSGFSTTPTLPANYSLVYNPTELDLVYTAPPFSGSCTWVGSTSWNTPANWLDGVTISNGVPGVTSPVPGSATFSGSGSLAVTLDTAPINLAALSFSNSSYTLSGNTLTLNSTSGTATVMVSSGTQTIESVLNLASTADMTVADLARLRISGQIIGTGALLKDGIGTLILSGTNNYTGGTNVNAGILAVTTSSALPDNQSLTVGAGGTLIFDPSYAAAPIVFGQSLAVSPVPEPSTLALLFAGLVVGFGAWRRKKK